MPVSVHNQAALRTGMSDFTVRSVLCALRHTVVACTPRLTEHGTVQHPQLMITSTEVALLYICAWYCLSTLLSLYNKYVLGKKYGLVKDLSLIHI